MQDPSLSLWANIDFDHFVVCRDGRNILVDWCCRHLEGGGQIDSSQLEMKLTFIT